MIGFNAYQYMTLEDQPLRGHSPTIRSLSQNLRKFEEMVAFQPASHADLVEFPFSLARYAKKTVSIGLPETIPANEKEAPAPDLTRQYRKRPKDVVLPTLSGVLQVQSTRGELRHMALLNGRLVQETDRIAEFTVSAISAQGVVLSGLGRQWTIDSPTPYHTSDSGQ